MAVSKLKQAVPVGLPCLPKADMVTELLVEDSAPCPHNASGLGRNSLSAGLPSQRRGKAFAMVVASIALST